MSSSGGPLGSTRWSGRSCAVGGCPHAGTERHTDNSRRAPEYAYVCSPHKAALDGDPSARTARPAAIRARELADVPREQHREIFITLAARSGVRGLPSSRARMALGLLGYELSRLAGPLLRDGTLVKVGKTNATRYYLPRYAPKT